MSVIPDPAATDWVPLWSLGAGPGACVMIEDKLLAADAATIDFQNIPSTYKSLFVVGQVRSSIAAYSDTVQMRMNGDAGSNYGYETLSGAANAAGATIVGSALSASCGRCTGGSEGATVASPIEVVVMNYAASTFVKPGFAKCFAYASNLLDIVGFHWTSTAVVNRLTFGFFGSGANFKAGSRLTLYALSDWIPGTAGGGGAAAPKIVRGTINGVTGAIIQGSGFTLAKSGTGQYAITFSPAFATVPDIVATPGPYYSFINQSVLPTVNGVSFTIVDNSFNFRDQTFSFIAIGT